MTLAENLPTSSVFRYQSKMEKGHQICDRRDKQLIGQSQDPESRPQEPVPLSAATKNEKCALSFWGISKATWISGVVNTHQLIDADVYPHSLWNNYVTEAFSLKSLG